MFVAQEDDPQVPELLLQAATATGGYLTNQLRYHYGKTYILCVERGGLVGTIWIDTAIEFMQYNRVWMSSDELLSKTTFDKHGFFRLAPQSEFKYHLIKKINKRKISDAQGTELSERYRPCSEFGDALLARIFSGTNAEDLRRALQNDKWLVVRSNVNALRHELHRRGTIDSTLDRAFFEVRDALRKVARIVQPTGICVAITSADLTLSAEVIAALKTELGMAFRKVAMYSDKPACTTGSERAHESWPASITAILRDMIQSRLVLWQTELADKEELESSTLLRVLKKWIPSVFVFTVGRQTISGRTAAPAKGSIPIEEADVASTATEIIRLILPAMQRRLLKNLHI
jgi:hypothetical protein